MTNLIGMGAEWLIGKVQALDAMVTREDAAMRAHSALVRDIEAKASRILDAGRRAVASREAASMRAKANSLASTWSAVLSRYRSAKATAVSWLRAVGLVKSSGLGALPVVPVTIGVTIAVVVWGAVEWQKRAREPETIRARSYATALDAVLAGQMTMEQLQSLGEQQRRMADADKPPGGPFGLDLAGIITPIVVLVGGYFVVRAVMSQRQRRVA